MSIASTIAPLASTWHHWDHGWWIVFVVLFWILVVGALVLLLRGPGVARWRGDRPERESALEVLDRRFAEDQLSIEDYQNRRRILSAHWDDE